MEDDGQSCHPVLIFCIQLADIHTQKKECKCTQNSIVLRHSTTMYQSMVWLHETKCTVFPNNGTMDRHFVHTYQRQYNHTACTWQWRQTALLPLKCITVSISTWHFKLLTGTIFWRATSQELRQCALDNSEYSARSWCLYASVWQIFVKLQTVWADCLKKEFFSSHAN